MTSNLTRSEAGQRARLLAVQSYQVELDLCGDDLTFSSTSTVRFSCAEPGAATFIDLTAPRVREITLNDTPVDADAFDGDRIALTGLAAENTLRVVADAAYSRTGEGLHRFTDPVDKAVYTYTDFEPFNAHDVFACFDQPDLKATFEFTVTGEDRWVAVSNMAVSGDPEPAGPGRLRWHFPPTPVISTYITCVAAGAYHVVRSEHDGIPLGIFCRQSLAGYLDPDEIFEVSRQGFDFYHREFGVRYPFGKYDQLFVPEFKTGAMENAGCVTFVENYLFRSRVTDARREARGTTILHEMAHMWFGDLVTMRWWDDLWLNESFATWASTVGQSEATRWPDAWTTFAQAEKVWAYRQDQLSSTHPVAADIPDIAAVEVNFDGITYAKGASVLKQLVSWVGRENFLTALRQYFDANAWSNATLGDLLSALEQTSGRELTSWSKAWLETAGVNTLRPRIETGADGAMTSFTVIQEAPEAFPELRPHRIGIGLYASGPGGLVRTGRVEADITGEATEIKELAGVARPDLILVNDDDLTYAKIRLDPESMQALIGASGRFADSLPEAICWSAAWDMIRDGELPARDFLRLVLAGVDHVTDSNALQQLLGQAAIAVRQYADQSWRPSGLAQLAATAREQLMAAEPGSDAQLLYAIALAGAASIEDDLELLRGLLNGAVVIDGLAIDTDLRWTLLQRLVSKGAAGYPQIEQELDRDRTDDGERQAARARAAIPRPEAKAEAWRQITGGAMDGATFRAALRGFTEPDQAQLLVPYAEAYYAEVGRIWQDWSSDMAQYFAEYAFPDSLVSQEALDRANDFLTRTDPPPALRRLLSEGRDGLVRSLRCRARDSAAAE